MAKLYRSTRDKKLTGLCGGLAEIMNVDATLLRLVVVVTAVFSGGTVILLYVLASIVIPKESVYGPGGPAGGASFNGPYGDYSYDRNPHAGHGPYGAHQHYTTHHTQSTHSTFGANQANAAHSATHQTASEQSAKPDIDEMMKEVETKALMKEIEQLRAKLAEYEKGDK